MTNVAKKKQLPAFLVLTIIALVAAVALALTNKVTEGPIAEHAARERNKAFAAVLTAAGYNEMTIPEGHASVTGLYTAVDENGATLGYTVVASASGYAGPVAVTLGIGNDGMVTGAVIGDGNFAETAGFGMKWKAETDRWEQFQQIDTANGGAIEAITGATVTSNAVLNATNAAINCVNEVRGIEARDVVEKGTPAAPQVEQAALEGGIHEGSAQGYQSEVRVQLTMDDAGVVTGLNIDAMGETMGFGTRATTEAAFAEQFVGKTAPFAAGDNIDVLSGASVTSKAVIEAVNMACNSPENPDAVPFTFGEEEPAVETVADPVPAGAKTGSGSGFAGGVTVALTLNEDGTIATLDIDVSKEVPPVCDMVLADSFVNQFIGKAGPFTAGENVDVATGATFSSNGVIEAVNAALTAPEAEVLTAEGSGFAGGVVVNVTLNEDGTIATLDIDVSKEVPPVCDMVLADSFVNQFIGKAGPFTAGENVDVVAGATFSSNGVIEALNKLFAAEEIISEEPAVEVGPVVETKTAKAEGFMDYVVVTVGLTEDGTIATLEIDVSNELEPNCNFVLKDEFINQFIGKKGPFVVGEGIDVATGATFSSNGAIAAINSLFAVEEAPATETLTAKGAGFGDGVVVTVTLNEDGTIATLDIDVSGEMAPNCNLVLGEEFINQFIGKKGPFVAGENVDVVATATFSSNGVIEALNSLFPVQDMSTGTEEAPVAEELTGKAEGFQSDVVVTLTVADGVITAIKVDSSNETPGFGTRCGEDEAYLAQFVGKKATPDLGEGIDALSGATVTSNAIIEAANAAIGVAVEVVDVTTEATTGATAAVEAPAEEPAAEPAAVVETKTAKAEGFMDYVVVTVGLAEDGTIATLEIDVSNELEPNCNFVLKDEFINQFIGKKGPFVVGEGIDVATAATFSSNGAIAALNKLFPAEEEAPATETLTAKGAGFGDGVVVTVTLNEDGTIATLDIDVSGEVPPICNNILVDTFVNQFIGKKGPFVAGENVDIVSGATFSSNGVIEALNSLFPAEEVIAEEPAAMDVTTEATTGATAAAGIPTQDMSVGNEEGPVAPNAATIVKKAYGGQDITVTVTFADDGTVAALVVDASTQSPGLGRKCAEERFTSQFIGGVAPFSLEGIDAISYATITTQAVIDAVNEAAAAQ